MNHPRFAVWLCSAAALVLLAVPAFAEDGHAYTYVALGDSITTGVGLKDAHFSSRRSCPGHGSPRRGGRSAR